MQAQLRLFTYTGRKNEMNFSVTLPSEKQNHAAAQST